MFLLKIGVFGQIEPIQAFKIAQFYHFESTLLENRLRVDSEWVVNFRLTRLTPTHSWTLLTSKRLFFTKKCKKHYPKNHATLLWWIKIATRYHHSLIMLLILVVTKGLLKNIVLKKILHLYSKILKNIFTAAVMSSNECFKLHDEKLNFKNAPNF